MDEAALLASSRRGDLSAYDRLVAAYQDRVYQTAYRITGHREDAWDAVQEAFLRAFRALRSFRGDAAFSTWMTRIAVNAALDVVRRRPPHAPVIPEGAAAGTDPSDEVLRRDQQRRVQQAIAALPADHRAVVVLRDVQDLSYEEIARTLRLPVGTVRSRLSRARETLRVALADLAPRSREEPGRMQEPGRSS
ncbi:MAG TPA: sigma-70 family RNA polymerase sigma factor [bacterium]